tara:strand:- start:2319 stop:2747 length:429 start_codon:yes stop_codon:yes gene_type:complete
MYLTINKIDDANRVIKYDTFKNADDADARIEALKALGITDAFVVDASTLSENFSIGQIGHLAVDISSQTVTWQQADFDSAVDVRAMAALREKRNRLLSETDHHALSDQTLTDEMRIYRAALRDMPSTAASDPGNPTWPEKPS